METIHARLNDLNRLVQEGKMLEAFETYYDDNVVMQENEGAPTIGKAENRERENQFIGSVVEFRGAEVLHTAVNENVSFVVWKYDYTHKDWGVRNYTQVSVQTWDKGKIVKEQFFYNN